MTSNALVGRRVPEAIEVPLEPLPEQGSPGLVRGKNTVEECSFSASTGPKTSSALQICPRLLEGGDRECARHLALSGTGDLRVSVRPLTWRLVTTRPVVVDHLVRAQGHKLEVRPEQKRVVRPRELRVVRGLASAHHRTRIRRAIPNTSEDRWLADVRVRGLA